MLKQDELNLKIVSSIITARALLRYVGKILTALN